MRRISVATFSQSTEQRGRRLCGTGPPAPTPATVEAIADEAFPADEDVPVEGPAVDIVPFDFHGDKLDVIPKDDKLFISIKRASEILGIDPDTQRKKLKQSKWARTVMMPVRDSPVVLSRHSASNSIHSLCGSRPSTKVVCVPNYETDWCFAKRRGYSNCP